MERIVVATDFGEASGEALRYAVALARTSGAKLELVHVMSDPAEELHDTRIGPEREGEVRVSGCPTAEGQALRRRRQRHGMERLSAT